MSTNDTSASTGGSDSSRWRAIRALVVAIAIAAAVGAAAPAIGSVGAASPSADVAATADGTATADVASSQSDPTLVVDDATVESGSTADQRVSLTEAPDGLAGFEVTLTVDDGDVATVANASYPDHFGLTTEPAVSTDGTEITVEAADLDDEVSDGATDVTLATIELEGVDDGETDLRVTELQVDADGGAPVDPSLEDGTVTVGDDSSESTNETDSEGSDGGSDDSGANGSGSDDDSDGTESDDGDDDSDGLPGFAFGSAIAAIAVLAAVLLARRD